MKHARIIILIILLVAFSTVYLTLAVDLKYVGSAKSNKYHYPDCKWAFKIKSENLVKFISAKEALATGYIPCKVCKPPNKD